VTSGNGSNPQFGRWFANADTLYLADEGNGDNTYSTSTNTYATAAAQTTAGLQKWMFNGTSFRTVAVAPDRQVLRGVSSTPGT
jgi:hypothetical protein